MRVPILLVCSVLIFNGAQAESLSDADRETLLDNLQKLRDAADSTVDARFRIALSAYRNAMSSDDAAMELYLDCKEKVDFKDLHKNGSDFREWRRKEAERLNGTGMRLALRHQLRWLMLTLQAASEKADRAKLTAEAQEAIDSIFRDADKLKYQQEILSQSATSSVFARAYDINHVKVEKWPMSPIEIEAIYDEILLPPYRRPAALATLRAGWVKRIQQETLKNELWSEKRRDRGDREDKEDREEKRIGMASEMQTPEQLKFLEEDLPKLKWEMEVDLFTYGDESGAAVRMLAHLQKYITHPSAREWSDELKKLLKPEVAVTAPKPAQEIAP